MVVKHKGEVVADMPVDPLADAAPLYERPVHAHAVPPTPILPNGCRRPSTGHLALL